MSAPVDKTHPGYAEGFWDALAGEPLFPDAEENYRNGWQAAWAAKTLLLDAGFSQDSANFSKTTTVGAGR